MEKITLDVTQGTCSSAKKTREEGCIPMIYYGKGVKPVSFSVEYQNFRRVYKKAGKSTIITIVNEKKQEFPVLVHEIQYHPVSDKMIHVDLIAVDLNKPITTKIPLVFVGISAAIKDEGGILVASKNTITVECLPKDLMHEIEVDITPLKDFHSVIKVADLKVPDTIKILDAQNINVVSVSAPRTEAELEDLEKAPVIIKPVETEVAEGEEKAAEEGGAGKGEGAKDEKKGKGKE
jgi:large subunit ribosomal protein L25